MTSMDYADIVAPVEMQTTRDWLEHTLRSLSGCGGASGSAEVECLRQGWGSFMRARSALGDPICLAGETHASGFGAHADSEILVTLNRPGARLTGLAGVDDNWSTRAHGSAPVVFSVEVEGRPVWTSGRQTEKSAPARLDVALGGVTRFTLRATAPEGINRAHADWTDLVVTLDDGAAVPLGEPLPLVSGPCFSFTCDGRPSRELLGDWTLREEHADARDDTPSHRLAWTDPRTSLTCVLELKTYRDFPVVEWVVRLRNDGGAPTPILEDVRSMDLRLDVGLDMVLHHQDGDYCTPDSYQPHRTKLESGTRLAFAPEGGRPTNRAFPYFNVEYPARRCGVITVVGWPGQWSATFDCTQTERRLVAGQEHTHFRLQGGEEVRTPLSVLMFWSGDRVRSQNLWRRWMLAHNLPRPGGKLPEPIFSTCMGLRQNQHDEKSCIDAFVAHDMKFDYWWMDAGWYPTRHPSWPGVGTWEVDRERFPDGIRAVSDHAHARGMKLVLWFEPERVAEGTWLDVHHPEWLLSCREDTNKLLDLGNPDAWRWLVEHVDGLIRSEGVDLYRQDHNFNPLPHWRTHDAPDRQGITEIRHVEGYLAFWDELRRRHPDMLIDSCASGGRRNDLETLRRSVPLLRSDYQYTGTGDPNEYAAGNQGHTWGIASWFPYYGSGVGVDNTYLARSFFCPAMGMGGGDPRGGSFDWTQYKRMAGDWRRIASYFCGDYYPLTSYSPGEDAWMAWQFHRPDLGAGMVQVFRRSRSPYVRAVFPLAGLDAETTYVVTDLDRPREQRRASGAELMTTGLAVDMDACPGSSIVVYERSVGG